MGGFFFEKGVDFLGYPCIIVLGYPRKEVMPMSPRPRSDDSKRNQYRLRMSDEELEKLEFCCEKLLLTKSEVIRSGLDAMYQKALEK